MMNFVLGDLRQLLGDIASSDYRFVTFDQVTDGRVIALRHDIDFSLESALDAAKIEADLGISATYFFMLSSNFYNVIAPSSQRLVNQIKDLGHVVSLHYDPTAHSDIDRGFVAERQIFEELFKVEIGIVSLHRPQGFLDDNNRPLPNSAHTYEDRFFKDMHYASDSRGSFRFGHPLESEAFRQGQPIHLLLHPIWWVNAGDSPSDKLRYWQRRHHDFLNEEMGRNCVAFDGRSVFAVQE